MKKIICLPAFVSALLISVGVVASAPGHHPSTKPSASLQKMWVEYDVEENNEYGMRIHIDFTVYDMQDRDAYIAAYFQYTDDQSDFLPDRNQRYHTTNGKVAVSKKITPTYNSSAYTDITLFMPYLELDLDAGTYDLTINLQLVYPQGGAIAWLKQHDITYTQYDEGRGSGTRGGAGNTGLSAKPVAAKSTGPRATFERMWVDHNVTDAAGLKGMMIHFKFVAYDMKDMEAYVATYFDYNDAVGGPLKDKNGKFNTSKGNVGIFKSIYPGYETAYYDDLRVFMPYEEFDLAAGEYKLSFEAMLIHKNGDVITKFGWYDFEYSRPKN